MNSQQSGNGEKRTEIISDLDQPLDVPTSTSGKAASSHPTPDYSDTATTAMPAAQYSQSDDAATTNFAAASETSAFPAAGTGFDPMGPLPFGEQSETSAPVQTAQREEISRRGTTDFGLLLLRIAVGVLLGLRGVQKLFGVFNGPGLDGYASTLSEAGFDQAKILAVTGGVVELVAAIMLLIGLATPLAAGALVGLVGLGIAIELAGPNSVAVLGETSRGLEAPILYLAALLALLFAGPGRLAADRRWAWSHRPKFSGAVWLLVAIGAGAALWYFLNGTNPLR